MRRRLYIAWILSLSLVFAQCGALLHEVGHLTHAGQARTPSVELYAGGEGACAACEAYAQIANPASAAAATLAACPAEFLPTPDPCYSIAGADAPTPRSRGPPQV
jgi:hypothetical protein